MCVWWLRKVSYVYLAMAGPRGIEPLPFVSKTKMISISPRTAKEKPRGSAKHTREVLHRCPGPCCLVLPTGNDPVFLHYQCSVMPLYYGSRAPQHCTRASFTASLQNEVLLPMYHSRWFHCARWLPGLSPVAFVWLSWAHSPSSWSLQYLQQWAH